MNLLRPRETGRHRADSMTSPRTRGMADLPARHARRPRPQIVRDFTGWAGLARACADAAAHPVLDLRITCPALFRADADLDPITQPFARIGDPR